MSNENRAALIKAARFLIYERATGFAPVPKPWKGFVLLLHYARVSRSRRDWLMLIVNH